MKSTDFNKTLLHFPKLTFNRQALLICRLVAAFSALYQVLHTHAFQISLLNLSESKLKTCFLELYQVIYYSSFHKREAWQTYLTWMFDTFNRLKLELNMHSKKLLIVVWLFHGTKKVMQIRIVVSFEFSKSPVMAKSKHTAWLQTFCVYYGNLTDWWDSFSEMVLV